MTTPMNRRDALKAAGVLVGGALVASSGVLTACATTAHDQPLPGRVLSQGNQDLLEEVADTLLPTTPGSPGAKAAGAGPAINLLLSDCYEPPDQQRALKGIADFRAACRTRAGGEFASLSRDKREAFLREVDAEAKKAGPTHYFNLFRELSNRAYFSSEIGMTRALRYIRIPGRWNGCVPLERGQPAWA